jgi:alpha-amylase
MKLPVLAVSLLFAFGTAHAAPAPWAAPAKPFVWENATVYFLSDGPLQQRQSG